jgi:type II secretory pathway pseudopilin PulG
VSARDRTWGLTIAELMVAIGLLAVVLVTIMTLFGQILKSSHKNALMSAGSFFAESVLERELDRSQSHLLGLGPGQNDEDAFDRDSYTEASGKYLADGQGEVAITDERNPTRYLYRVEAERVDFSPAAGRGQMWRVEVEVRWGQDTMAGTSKARAGSGGQMVKRTRLAYFGADQG